MSAKKLLYFKSRIRDYIHKKGMWAGSDVVEGTKLNNLIQTLLDAGIERAKLNKRKTVRPHDVYVAPPPVPIPPVDKKILKQVIGKLDKTKVKKRKLMFYDIVNYIIRNKMEEEPYDQIILWSNAHIRNGYTFLEEINLWKTIYS